MTAKKTPSHKNDYSRLLNCYEKKKKTEFSCCGLVHVSFFRTVNFFAVSVRILGRPAYSILRRQGCLSWSSSILVEKARSLSVLVYTEFISVWLWRKLLACINTLESVPGTNQYWAISVKFLAQGHNSLSLTGFERIAASDPLEDYLTTWPSRHLHIHFWQWKG